MQKQLHAEILVLGEETLALKGQTGHSTPPRNAIQLSVMLNVIVIS